MTHPRDAIIRVIDVEGEPLRITALEQPVHEGGFHSFNVTNFPGLLEEIAEAWGRRARAAMKNRL